MIGDAALLAVDVPLPMGIHLRRVTSEPDVRSPSAMQEDVFGGEFAQEMAEALLRKTGICTDRIKLWLAEADGEIVSSGRLEPVPGTEFAGILGRRHATGMAWSRALPSAHWRPVHDQRSCVARG